LEDKIKEYVINNLENFHDLTKVYREQKQKLLSLEPLFKEEINQQFDDKIKFMVSLEITRDTGCSYEDALIFIEEINIIELLSDGECV
jgi:hypothetical protein